MLSFSTPGTWGQGPSESIPAKLAALEATVASLVAENSALAARVAALEAEQALSDYVTVDQNEIEGLKGPHVIFTGANVHIRSGSGDTWDRNNILGLGNLIVGYNEKDFFGFHSVLRTGSHNLVVGAGHSYTACSGFVAGHYNEILVNNCSVTGGINNKASGVFSSVSGGISNQATGAESWVGGGHSNHATGNHSSVSGGLANYASGEDSSVSGGEYNEASGLHSSISGGSGNTVSSEDGYAPFP